jgi:hypothetical protein
MKKQFIHYGFILIMFFAIAITSCQKSENLTPSSPTPPALPSIKNSFPGGLTYDQTVAADSPVGYWMLIKGYTSDASGNGMTGTYYGSGRGQASLPNGETASIFNGTDNYFEIPDNNYLEVTRTGILTIEAWMRPDTLQFTNYEGTGYV